MTHFSVHPRHRIFVKGYRFLSFAKNMGKNIGKKISKNLSGKYSQNFLIILNNYTLRTTSKRVIQKTAEVTGDLIGNKVPNRITKAPKKSQQNKSETFTNDNDKETLKERYISPGERQKNFDDVRLV